MRDKDTCFFLLYQKFLFFLHRKRRFRIESGKCARKSVYLCSVKKIMWPHIILTKTSELRSRGAKRNNKTTY